ncbi:MAG: N-acetylmuramoyl-L-alanine amidase [Chloroflexota bacterium]|nr:MAG: N-acetylmuramoyl-L-alanine amidase [Chloroflexota bacterium]
MPRLTRRQVVTGMVAALLGGPVVVAAESGVAPRTRAWTWRGGLSVRSALSADGGLRGATIRVPFPFNALAIIAAQPDSRIRVRTSADTRVWSDWQTIEIGESHGRKGDGSAPAALAMVETGQYLEISADEGVAECQIDVIDSAPSVRSSQSLRSLQAGVSIVSRQGWSADESYRYDERGAELWTPRVYTPHKVVVHHTATSNTESNPAATVRAIHYYHARTLGWGDIGYNYLVDRNGVVYEGRYGGQGVEAGHALGHNGGSIGIACIGTYSSVQISSACRSSLTALIADRARTIDPIDSSWFVDGEMTNVMGHRDAMQYRAGGGTACPGNTLYGLMSTIREEVVSTMGGRPSARLTIDNLAISSNGFIDGGVVGIAVTVRNTGTATVATQDPRAALQYDERESADGRGFGGQSGTWRVALDTRDGAAGFPFRWGLPDALAPGQSATVTGAIQLWTPGRRDVKARVVREGRGEYVDSPTAVSLVVVDRASLGHRVVVPVSPRRSGS